ncbi:hypothetical protein TCDM_10197 [Trypanosoma cruzi Dm28c]|uniref:Uncharacterized protein n=1 Tax=Trypanosoma cruzi Dm28c TaxID=1416333 RepID=V5B3L5_TRYCR|nr:hypothetical protein TCDM_10197 [Trypanosoma cruzi Dm28c]
MTCANVRHNGGEAHTKRMRPSTAVAAHHAHHTRRKSDSPRAPSLLLPFMPTEEAAATATASTRYKRSIQIHSNVHRVCMWFCVPADTRSKEVKTGAEHEKRRTNKNVQRRCVAEATRRRPLKLITALQPKQRPFIKKINENKKKLILTLPTPHTLKNKKKNRKKKIRPLLRLHSNKKKRKRKTHKKAPNCHPAPEIACIFCPQNKIKRYLNVFQPSDPLRVRTSFIFHGVICVLLLPSALSSARECGPQSTVTRVCGD